MPPITQPLEIEIIGGDGFDWLSWLATVAPSLVIALLVVWLGHRFTMRQAISARTDQRTEDLARWTRSERVQAYARFQSAWISFEHCVSGVGTLLLNGEQFTATTEYLAAEVEANRLADQMKQALSVVEVVGSQDYRDAAQQLFDDASDVLDEVNELDDMYERATKIGDGLREWIAKHSALAALARKELFPT